MGRKCFAESFSSCKTGHRFSWPAGLVGQTMVFCRLSTALLHFNAGNASTYVDELAEKIRRDNSKSASSAHGWQEYRKSDKPPLLHNPNHPLNRETKPIRSGRGFGFAPGPYCFPLTKKLRRRQLDRHPAGSSIHLL